MEFLQNDELSGEVEPHRMFCKGCQEWVDLSPKRRYVMQPWVNHRKVCIKQRGQSEKYSPCSPMSIPSLMTRTQTRYCGDEVRSRPRRRG